MNLEPHLALHSCFRGQVRHALVGRNVLRTAIGIATVIERVDAQENVKRLKSLRPSQGERKKDRIPRRDVSDGYPRIGNITPLPHIDLTCQRGPAECPQIELDHLMPGDSRMLSDAPRLFQLPTMPLVVIERQCVWREARLF